MSVCLACDLINNSDKLPGGKIFETGYWIVEHCVGPLGVGTLIVKPIRHCVQVADLTAPEAREMGLLLHKAATVVQKLSDADQVYVCLWSLQYLTLFSQVSG